MKTALPLIAALLGLGAAGAAYASPVGNWQVTHYDFATGASVNTTQVCLSADGTFRQDGWLGYWKSSQSGANVMARASATSAVATAADVTTVVTDSLMTGFNESWSGNNLNSGFYTVSVWTRLSTSC
ncbi:hypothetical protein AB1286_06025 [Trinickia sp. NRRL B-1857]|uniref:hypothetical protein n=1 Tax=Trinickia sp. NRRL B-1857 TaxID=3162879 RepID=UPI003D2D2BF9